jgi:hypothetical protein
MKKFAGGNCMTQQKILLTEQEKVGAREKDTQTIQ